MIALGGLVMRGDIPNLQVLIGVSIAAVLAGTTVYQLLLVQAEVGALVGALTVPEPSIDSLLPPPSKILLSPRRHETKMVEMASATMLACFLLFYCRFR